MSWITSQLHSGKPLISYDRRYKLKGGMAYKRKRYTRKKPYVKPRYFRKGYDRTGGFYGRYNKKPLALDNEVKFLDFTTDDAVIAAAGSTTVASFCLLTQGTGESQRIGRRVKLTALGWRGNINLPPQASGAGVNGDVVRIIIYHDKQANGAVAAPAELLVNEGDFQTFNNLANTKRFRTLMDRTYTLNPIGFAGNGTANDSASVDINDTWFKKCNMIIDYDGATNAITELSSNNVGMIALSKNGIAGVAGVLRMRFVG